MWSDAGAISITATTLLYDGGFLAQPGSPQGNGGSLTIVAPQTNRAGDEHITVRQSGDIVPDTLSPGDALVALAGSVVFFANRLDGSGIADLTLSMGPVTGDAIGTAQGKFAPGTLTFSGNVALTGLDNLFLDASLIVLADPAAPAAAGDCNVCLEAHYVALRGAGNIDNVMPQAGTGILRIAGDSIDIARGRFRGRVKQADGRFQCAVPVGRGTGRFRQQRRHPAAGAAGQCAQRPGAGQPAHGCPHHRRRFEPDRGADLSGLRHRLHIEIGRAGRDDRFPCRRHPAAPPLSAGGAVTVSAAHIAQDGVLLAPLGTIRLGAQTAADLSADDPTYNTIGNAVLVATRSVTFGPGSVTSVSLAGQTVPFGQTANGTSWSYDSLTGQPLAAPPAKNLVVSGAALDVQSGATIDISGGGDIQAIEFVPGTGGTRDVLAGNANVFAVIPGYNPAARRSIWILPCNRATPFPPPAPGSICQAAAVCRPAITPCCRRIMRPCPEPIASRWSRVRRTRCRPSTPPGPTARRGWLAISRMAARTRAMRAASSSTCRVRKSGVNTVK